MAKPEQGEVDPNEYLKSCLRIEPLALQEEFVRVPADFAYWAEQYKVALEKHLTAKAELERAEARSYLLSSNKVNPATAKPFTVDAIKALVTTDPDVVLSRDAAVAAEVDSVRLKNILEAIRTKREMLISLGAQVRSEMEHDPLVRKRASDARMTGD